MRGSPLEQLGALSSSRGVAAGTTDNKPQVRPDDEAIFAVQKDMAIERISAELSLLLLDGEPEVFGAGIRRFALDHFWEWIQRDLDQNAIAEINKSLGGQDQPTEREVELTLGKIIDIVTPIIQSCFRDDELRRRLTIQMGGPAVFETVPVILSAFGYVGYIKSGVRFGRELSGHEDPDALKYALEHIEFPSNDVKGLWCQSFTSGVSRTDILAATIAKLSYASTSEAITKSGFAEFVDALLINAQQQIEIIENQSGIFKDIDLTCRAIDRFHQIARGLQFHLELSKSSKWNYSLERLVKRGANSLSGKFSDILRDVKKVLGPAQNGKAAGRLDPADVLHAYNGLYILAATRSARESLAVNAVVDRVWKDVGISLEAMVDPIFEHFKLSAGSDALDSAQVDIAIKFCSIRFGEDYAAILSRNKANILRRASGVAAHN